MTTYLLFPHPGRRRLRLDDLLGTIVASSADEAAAKLGLRIIVTSNYYHLEDSEGKRFIMVQPVELKNPNHLI